jgi:DNA-binding CsgD family transcriptional regulator
VEWGRCVTMEIDYPGMLTLTLTVPRRDTRTVAWIEVHTALGSAASPDDRVIGYALDRIERAVRADDKVCPVSTSSVVVQFGTVASAVSLEILGDRLARAIGPGLPFDHGGIGLSVAVGMAAPGIGDTDSRVTVRARSAARTSARALGGSDDGRRDTTTAVTVEAVAARPGCTTSMAVGRRAVHRYGTGRIDGVPGLLLSDGPAPRGAVGPSPTAALCVLVVDPMATDDATIGFPARTAASVAGRTGCRTTTAAVSPDEPLITTVDEVDVDLVVLVLDGAWVGRSPNWAAGAWGLPARLTTAYQDKGIPVLVVGTGAGAGAMAGCVAQGALALFTLDRLGDALRSLDGFSINEAREVAALGFPARFRSLLGLTTGERKILFYLTEGWPAQDIADQLVVSLNTVRSHIRSVLRKLGVRSQLGAVAIANSRDLEHHRLTANS